MTPAPGSHAATARGCTCEPTANGYGVGVAGSERHAPLFEVRGGCQLHGRGSGYTWSPGERVPDPVMPDWADDAYRARKAGRPKKARS